MERLQDISEADAIAEGVSDTKTLILDSKGQELSGLIAEYAVLWESIAGPGSWDANPWVWVVEFKRLIRDPALDAAWRSSKPPLAVKGMAR